MICLSGWSLSQVYRCNSKYLTLFARLGLLQRRTLMQDSPVLALLCNLLIGAAMTGIVVAGVALFWIAKQDGSAAGRNLGILLVLATITTAGILTAFNLWF